MKKLSHKALRGPTETSLGAREAAEERRLLAAARRGDRAAVDAVTRRIAGSLHRFGRGFCRDPHDAEDVMQEVLLALIAALPSFRGDSSLSSWAYVVARNACARRRRREARHRPLETTSEHDAALTVPAAAGPERTTERRQLRAALEQAIAALPDKLRDVLILRDVEGMSAAQVGQRLRLGERAVKSRLHRARVTLRATLAPHAERAAVRAKGCPDVAATFSRFLEGDLDGTVCDRLEEHVAACEACGDECARLRSLLGECRAWRDGPAPAPLQRAVRQAIRAAVGGKKG